MSFFSRSKSKGHYPKHNHGGEYYKRPSSSGGLFGRIVEALTGSHKHSGSYSNHYHHEHNSNHGHEHSHYDNYHRRKSSWS